MSEYLDFDQKIKLMKLVMELRQSAPIGAVGLLETRDLFASLFPEFAEVRDDELDELLRGYAASLLEKGNSLHSDPSSAILGE